MLQNVPTTVFVMVYVPGAIVDKFITPVVVLSAVVEGTEKNVPAILPLVGVGSGAPEPG